MCWVLFIAITYGQRTMVNVSKLSPWNSIFDLQKQFTQPNKYIEIQHAKQYKTIKSKPQAKFKKMKTKLEKKNKDRFEEWISSFDIKYIC